MKILLVIYVVVALVAGLDAWIKTDWFVGLAGITAPMLACWAGIGLRGSLIAGNRSQIAFGIVMAAIFLGVAHWLLATVNYRIGLFGVSFGGGVWYLLGAAIGFIVTSRKDTESPTAPGSNK